MNETDLQPEILRVTNLGSRKIDSPLERLFGENASAQMFFNDDERIVADHDLDHVRGCIESGTAFPCLEAAGPRRKIYFHPPETTCAVITCGGLCPGLNDVIRSVVLHAHYRYGVKRILGIPYGFEGLNPAYGHSITELTPESVANIHTFGGTALGTSRGPQDVPLMVDRLQELGVSVLFLIGGDGTQRGGQALWEEAKKRGYPLAVIGIPKTIDNDMIYMDKSFGYETAVAAAVGAINAAHTEARSARHGVGLVKLMGRHSGFIACAAAIASGEVNCVLIPEVPFALEGPDGFLEFLFRRVVNRGHAVIALAEGAGQEYLTDAGGTDASGNRRLGDIGLYLRERIEAFFHERGSDLNMKYIDPSYTIRGIPASPNDRIYCMRLGQAAVHAAMAGKTGIVVARWHSAYIHVPIPAVTAARRSVEPTEDFWLAVLESTGQPPVFIPE